MAVEVLGRRCKRPLRLVLIGPPGAGKGTQARLLASRLGLVHIDVGERLRREVAEGTEIGRRVRGYLRAGKLAPDSLTLQVVERALGPEAERRGFVLDGFPRSMAQVEALEELLRRRGLALDAVVQIDVPDQVALERLEGRARPEVPGAPRASIGTLWARLRSHHAVGEAIARYYAQRGLLCRVSGLAPPEEVFASIIEQVCEESPREAS